jgi:hypothetical protein
LPVANHAAAGADDKGQRAGGVGDYRWGSQKPAGWGR